MLFTKLENIIYHVVDFFSFTCTVVGRVVFYPKTENEIRLFASKESRKHQRMMMKSDRMLRCDAMRCNDQML